MHAGSQESTVIMVDASGTPRTRTVAPYDFRRPNKVGRDHARALQLVHETFARQFSTILSSTLRALAPVTLRAIEQRTYDEYVSELANPSFIAILTVEPLPGQGILYLPLDAAMEVVDRLLGGPGGEAHPDRPMTEIEIGVLRGLLDRVMRELTYAFESFIQVRTSITGTESNPQFAQVAGLSDMVVVATYGIAIGERSWEASLAFPFMMLQPALDAYSESKRTRDVDSGELARARALVDDQLREAPVEIGVTFNTVRLSAEEIVSMQLGDVLPLRHRIDAPLTITVGGVACFQAMPGRSGRRLAAMVTGDLRDPADGPLPHHDLAHHDLAQPAHPHPPRTTP
jgi:flagellar motor switch protein FliM